MEKRTIARLDRDVSVIGLGTWQLGADWGDVGADAANGVLETAHEHGVTFFDTADVYGDGRSERFCAALQAHHPDVFVATKMGRRVEQLTENYTRENFLAWNDRSRENLGEERLDLVQLHCPPDGVFESDAVFDWLDQMVADERIAAYGVSVETWPRRCRRSLGPAWPASRSSSTAFGSNRSNRSSRRRSRRAWGSSPACRWPPACCRGATTRTPRSRRTTTAISTGAARRSTLARHSPGFRMRSGSRPPAGSANWSTRARRWRSSRCGGSSISPASAP